MGSKDKLQQIDIKNPRCYYFYDIILYCLGSV